MPTPAINVVRESSMPVWPAPKASPAKAGLWTRLRARFELRVTLARLVSAYLSDYGLPKGWKADLVKHAFSLRTDNPAVLARAIHRRSLELAEAAR
jgi:hypothetical protein